MSSYLQPKAKERRLTTGRGGADGIRPASAFKLPASPFDVVVAPNDFDKTGRGGADGIRPASVIKEESKVPVTSFDMVHVPNGREKSHYNAELKDASKHRPPRVSGDDDGGLVLVGKTGRGGAGNTRGHKVSSKAPKSGVRRPTLIRGGLDLLAAAIGKDRVHLRRTDSLHTVADVDDGVISHHITPFILTEYETVNPPASPASTFPCPPSPPTPIYAQSSGSSSSAGPALSSFTVPSTSSVTISSYVAPSLREPITLKASYYNDRSADQPPHLDLPDDWATTPFMGAFSGKDWLISRGGDAFAGDDKER